MRVLNTGGTGFVGSHTVAAVIGAGHAVRLLVRRPERVDAALAPLGIWVPDLVSGDVLDPESVQAAVAGCDAVIHAPTVYSLDPRQAASVLATNARATEIVLEAAVKAGLDPIVYVSSYVALLPSRDVLTPDSPVGAGGPAYPRSKARSELIARRHQSAGAPVVTTYPGAVVGRGWSTRSRTRSAGWCRPGTYPPDWLAPSWQPTSVRHSECRSRAERSIP
jgi:dihydroflavonol-4-reductase